MPTLEEILITICTAIGSGLLAALIIYYKTSSKKIAEIDTISSKIDEISAQQVTLTTATEQVKEDIKHQVWKKQEYNQIIREKIEEYYTCIDDLQYFLINRYHCLFSNDKEVPEDEFKKSSLISHLYLPETHSKHKELADVMNDYYNLIIEICDKQLNGGTTFHENLDEIKAIRDRTTPIIFDLKMIAQSKIDSIIQVD